MSVSVAIVKETLPGERRVALEPGVVKKLLTQGGFNFRLQHGAGLAAGFVDADYADVVVCADYESTVQSADIVLQVNAPRVPQAELMPPGSLLATSLLPYDNPELMQVLVDRRITGLALELMPRISRAHSMNVTSSQGTIAGYKAALLAAELSPRLWPMVTAPAGTVRPSTVVVVGAGTAGLQAIATARRLGARVEAYDIRPSAFEQVESLGAKMIETGIDVHGTSGHGRALTESEREQQQEVLANVLSRAHAVICTAALPGRSAPRIITTAMVEGMPRGGVVVDIAARSGGNCELTEPGKTVWHGDKRIVGAVDLASAASVHASELYSRNMFHLLNFLVKGSTLSPDFDDEIMQEIVVTHEGEVLHEPTARMLGLVSDESSADEDKAATTSATGSGADSENDEKKPVKKSRPKKNKSQQQPDNTADWVETDEESFTDNNPATDPEKRDGNAS